MEHSLCFPCTRISPYRGEPLTGEPDAGDPPVRFGGRGERNQSFLPTPISHPGSVKYVFTLPKGEGIKGFLFCRGS